MMRVKVKGCRREDVDVMLSERSVLIGPNGSGKSLTIEATRLIACGEYDSKAGSTPGAFMAKVSNGGWLKISAQVGESEGAEMVIDTPQQKKVKTLEGYDCVLANLQLDGSAEATKAFIASNLKLDPSVTLESVAKLIGAELPVANNIIDALAALAKTAKAASSVARATEKKARSAAEGNTSSAANLTVETAGDLQMLQNRLLDLNIKKRERAAAIAKNTDDVASWNAIQLASIKSRERYETEKAKVSPSAPTEATINDLRVRLVDESAEAERLEKAFGEAQREWMNAKDKTAQLLGALRSFPRPTADAKNCGSCGQSISGDYIKAQELKYATILGEWKLAQAADTEKELMQVAARTASLTKSSEALRLESEIADIVKKKERALSESNARDGRLRQLETAANEAAEAAAGGNPPDDVDALKLQFNDFGLDILKAQAAVIVAQQRETSLQNAARLKSEALYAEKELKRCTDFEAKIKSVRDALLRLPANKFAAEMSAIAPLLDAEEVTISPGDEDFDPVIGVIRWGVVWPFHSISEGRRAAFLAMLAATRLERSAAPVEKRILLIEAGACDLETFYDVLTLIKDTKIGYIVAAYHGECGGVEGYDSPAYYSSKVEF